MTLRIPSIKNMDHLLKHLTYFQDQDNQFYKIINKPPQFPFASYSGSVDVFYQDLYNENMIQMFDWQEWSGEAEKYFNDPELLSTADLVTLQKLFTSIIRADRFCEGLLGEMLDNGVILNLLIRLQSIREEILDRFHGAIIGLTVGDAMGVPLEFKDPGSFEPVNDMVGGESFDLSPGMDRRHQFSTLPGRKSH